MDLSTTTEVLIGALMPGVIALANRAYWSPRTKGAVAMIGCLGVATVIAFLGNAVTWESWAETAIAITGPALALYHVWWKPSLIAPAIEVATTPDRSGD